MQENTTMGNQNWIFVPGYIDKGLSNISTKKRGNLNRIVEEAAEVGNMRVNAELR